MISKERNVGLDILKIVASIFIVIGHFQGKTGYLVCNLGLFGWTDVVELFFIISGFLSKDLHKFGSTSGLVRCIVRLYPMVFISTSVAILLNELSHLLYGTPATGILNVFTSYLLIFKFGIWQEVNGVDPFLWYIGILIFCYTLACFAKWMDDNIGIKYWITSVGFIFIGLLFVYADEQKPMMNYYVGRGMVGFFLGVLLFKLFNLYNEMFRTDRTKIIIFVLECIFLIELSVWLITGNQERIENIWSVQEFVLYPLVIHVALQSSKHIKSKFIEFLGAASFEFYIWQATGFFILNEIIKYNEMKVNMMCLLIFIILLMIWGCLMYCVEQRIDVYIKNNMFGRISR